MKNVKNDTKYIIKRILIGVGITILLFNLKKCNVYADTKNYYIWCRSTSSNQVCMSNYEIVSGLTYLGETITTESDTYNFYTRDSYNYDFGNVIFKNEETGYIYVFTIIKDSNLDISNYKKISFGMPLTSSLSNTTMQFPTSAYIYGANNTLLYNMDSITSSTDGLYPWSQRYRIYEIDNNNNVGLITQSDFTTLLRNNKITYVGSNYNDIELSFGDTPFYTPTTDPIANYTKVDLTGYQAVLLVPKNYQTMLSDSSHTNEAPPGTFRTYLDLEYYSQYCTRSSLINVENTQDIMLNNIGVGIGNISETITGTCYEEPTQSIMSYEFDQYSGLKARGLLIYNAEQNWSGGFNPNEQESPFYGTSYVWYDPTLYNAYLVQSFESFSANIQYKDYSGEDKVVNVESLPTFNEAMENAIENVDSPTQLDTNKAKLTALFEFIKLPIVFIKRLSTNNCSPVILPLPHTGQNITLQCMSSSVYNRYLPPALTSVLSIIINGLLIYRCTLTNIDIFTNILDPVDNKLEAIDL